VLFALGALATWAATVLNTESEVFSAMTLGLLVVCMGAAVTRQRLPKT